MPNFFKKLNLLVLSLGMIFLFENCGQTYFVDRVDNNSIFATSTFLVEDGRPATNKKILTGKYFALTRIYTEMRVALDSEFNDNTPWITFSEEFNFDLGNNGYDSSGLKDGVKTVRAQLKTITGDITDLEDTIILDTLAPRGIAQNLMAQGLNGTTYSTNDRVTLAWNAYDIPATNGSMSNLDPSKAIQVGWSYIADCSQNNLHDLSSPMSNTNSYNDFRWPNVPPADSFYICVLVKDLAGNQTSILSQPMNFLWKVIIGDNNFGSGGTFNASNLRFNYPYDIESDSEGNIYIYDLYYGQLRKVAYDTQIVSTILGNGSSLANPSLASTPQLYSMTFDSQDRLYVMDGGKIVRYSPDARKEIFTREEITPYLGLGRLFIKKGTTPEEDVLYASYYQRIQRNDSDPSYLSEAQVYIFKIRLADLNLLGHQLTLNQLISNYKFAGNGKTFTTGVNSPFEQTVGQDSMGYISSLFVDDNDDVFVGTVGDGNGYPYGENALRLIRKDANQVLKNYKVISSYTWAYDLKTVYSNGSKFLLLGGEFSFKAINLTEHLQNALDQQVPISTVIAPWGNSELYSSGFGSTVVIRHGSQNLPSPKVFVAHTGASQITELNSDFQVVANYGRKAFNTLESNGLQAALSNPSSVIEDRAGNYYFFDSTNCLLRKSDPNGSLSISAGTPCSIQNAGTILSEFPSLSLSAGTGYNTGYLFPLVYDAYKNHIYLGYGSTTAILDFDLTAKTVRKFESAPLTTPSHPTGWPVYGLALQPSTSTADAKLFVSRFLTINPLSQVIEKVTMSSSISAQTVIGNKQLGDIITTVDPLSTPVMNPFASVVDPLNGDLYFVSSYYKLYRYRNNTIKELGYTHYGTKSLKLLFENNILHFVSTTGSQLFHFTLNNNDQIATTERLCIPGTFLNSAENISLSNDGNILIADTKNNRILKYFIRNTQNQLVFSACN